MKFEPMNAKDKELVSLDTLMPFPAWYQSYDGEYYAHDGTDGYTRISADYTVKGMFSENAYEIEVYPKPYRMVAD